MSTFKVEEKIISEIYPHPNADRLELGKVQDMTFQFCIRKDEFKSGDTVIYFPVDSVLPEPLIQHLGISNLLSGKDKNRIRTVKLRDEISQGFVTTTDPIKQFLGPKYNPDTLTEDLEVKKYEPPSILTKGANLKRLPPFLSSYDIEGCDRFPRILDLLMDKPCHITEKLEGMNFGVSIDTDNQIIVNQRNFSIECLPEHKLHTFWEVTQELELDKIVKKIKDQRYPESNVTLRGELIGPGVQGNYYNLEKHTVRLFELEVNGIPVDSNSFLESSKLYNFDHLLVPTLTINQVLREWLNGKTIQEASNGQSVLCSRLREGIVIKPMEEEQVDRFGRLFLKQRSPEYLAKTGN